MNKHYWYEVHSGNLSVVDSELLNMKKFKIKIPSWLGTLWQELFPSIIAGKIFRHNIGRLYFLPKGQRLKLFEYYLHIIIKGNLLTLVGTPIISQLPESIKMVHGIKMKCEGVGHPPVQVMWIKGSVMLANGIGSAEYRFKKGDTSGNYKCIATNKEGTTNMTVEVTVMGRYDSCIRVLLQQILVL